MLHSKSIKFILRRKSRNVPRSKCNNTCKDDSDECIDTCTSDYHVKEEQLPIFKDVKDRDCSYVQEVLGTACGFPVNLEQ